MPKRIQRKRTKGWRMPKNAVYVGRPTKWGNRFRLGIDGNAAQCMKLYADVIAGNVWTSPTPEEIPRLLRGKDLACWCPLDRSCHADVLLEIANKQEMGL